MPGETVAERIKQIIGKRKGMKENGKHVRVYHL